MYSLGIDFGKILAVDTISFNHRFSFFFFPFELSLFYLGKYLEVKLLNHMAILILLLLFFTFVDVWQNQYNIVK